MESVALVAGLLLPWLLGVALLGTLYSRSADAPAAGQVPWLAGTGLFVGAFVLTLWMRALSLIGIHFSVVAIAAPLVVLTGALMWMAVRRNAALSTVSLRDSLKAVFASPGLGRGARAIWWVLVGWLAIRFVLLAMEVALRPLYPWDAWIQWATKARVWYELGYLAPFARVTDWFAAQGAVYFDASPEYPPTVPLLQVWASLVIGRWDDALMNWPWWQIAVALVFAVYGGLRRLGVGALVALIGAFMVASLPLANVHVALAGYADLPLAAYFCVAVLTFVLWNDSRGKADLALALFLLVACTQIKNPGVFWAITVIPGFMVALFPKHGLKLAGTAFALAILLLAVLAQTNVRVFNYRLHLNFEPAWRALGESLFLLGNWNLLWYGLIGIVLLMRRELFARSLAPFTTVIVGGLLFLFMVFGFTTAREWMAQQTTVNRATLHLAPLITLFIVIAYREFAARWTAAHPTPATAPVPQTTSAVLPPAPAPVAEPVASSPVVAGEVVAGADETPAVTAHTDSPPAPQRV